MCMGAKPPKLPPPPAPPIDVPVAPMESPEDANKDSTGKLRKAKGRGGLKIDLAQGSTSGLSIPL